MQEFGAKIFFFVSFSCQKWVIRRLFHKKFSKCGKNDTFICIVQKKAVSLQPQRFLNYERNHFSRGKRDASVPLK